MIVWSTGWLWHTHTHIYWLFRCCSARILRVLRVSTSCLYLFLCVCTSSSGHFTIEHTTHRTKLANRPNWLLLLFFLLNLTDSGPIVSIVSHPFPSSSDKTSVSHRLFPLPQPIHHRQSNERTKKPGGGTNEAYALNSALRTGIDSNRVPASPIVSHCRVQTRRRSTANRCWWWWWTTQPFTNLLIMFPVPKWWSWPREWPIILFPFRSFVRHLSQRKLITWANTHTHAHKTHISFVLLVVHLIFWVPFIWIVAWIVVRVIGCALSVYKRWPVVRSCPGHDDGPYRPIVSGECVELTYQSICSPSHHNPSSTANANVLIGALL